MDAMNMRELLRNSLHSFAIAFLYSALKMVLTKKKNAFRKRTMKTEYHCDKTFTAIQFLESKLNTITPLPRMDHSRRVRFEVDIHREHAEQHCNAGEKGEDNASKQLARTLKWVLGHDEE